MHVLVTGATGRVGSRFVPRLLDQGEDVRILVRDAGRAEALRQRGAEVTTGDLRNPGDLRRAVDGADAVVHLGASFRGVAAEEAVAINQTATVELARAALQASVARFVFVSINLVYGPGRGRPTRADDERRPPAEAAYPRSKLAAEDALLQLHRDHGLGLRWARGWPAHQRLHLVHHADVGQGLLRALRANGVDGRAYNVADDAPITAFELHTLNREPNRAEPPQLPGSGRYPEPTHQGPDARATARS